MRVMLIISYASCFRPSLAISLQFALKMYVGAQIYGKKIMKTSNFEGSRSFTVIDVDKTKKPVTSACYDKQHVCTYLQPFLH